MNEETKAILKELLVVLFLGLLLIILVPDVLGYAEINPSIPVQYDNGTDAVLTSSALCYASILKNNNYIARNQLMTNDSGYYNYSFTPNETGNYYFNMECYYRNESQFYFEVFSITDTIVQDSSTYTLSKNIEIDLQNTDLGREKASFKVFYTSNNEPRSVANAYVRVLKDNAEIEIIYLKELSTGMYQFDGDFSDYDTGKYELEINMNDYKKTIEINIKSNNLITSFIIDEETQSLNIRNVIIGISILLLLGILGFLLLKRSK